MAIDQLTGQWVPDATTMPVDPNLPSTKQSSTGLISAPAPEISGIAQPAPTVVQPTQFPTAVSGAPGTPGWNVTPDQTVEGRIKGIIDQNSPLMQQAQTQATQQSNSRGLLNSSMAVGAAQDSLYKAATPIATADANIMANAAQFNALDPNKQAEIVSRQQLAGMDINSREKLAGLTITSQEKVAWMNIQSDYEKQKADLASRKDISDADRAATMERLDTELKGRETMFRLENDAKIAATGLAEDYKVLINSQQGAAGLYDTYQKAVMQINTSQLDAANKQKALDDQFMILQEGMAMYQDIEGLNLNAIIGGTGGSGSSSGPGSNPGGGEEAVAAAAEAPNTYAAGESDDPIWEKILADFNAIHEAKYGIPMNRPWDSDADAQNAYAALKAEYGMAVAGQ